MSTSRSTTVVKVGYRSTNFYVVSNDTMTTSTTLTNIVLKPFTNAFLNRADSGRRPRFSVDFSGSVMSPGRKSSRAVRDLSTTLP